MPPVLVELRVGDEPESWRRAGFTVDDDGRCRVGAVTIRLVGREQGKRIQAWGFAGLPEGRTELDGLATFVAPAAPAGDAGSPEHPNGTVVIDHLVLLTPDMARTTNGFEAVGIPARRTRHTDTYGAPFLQTFFRAGEVILELIGPEEPGDDAEQAAKAAVFFGLAYTVCDLDALTELLGPHLGQVKDAVQEGRRITTLRHKELDVSVATAFLSAGVDSLGAPSGEGS